MKLHIAIITGILMSAFFFMTVKFYKRHDENNFEYSFPNFSSKILNGFTTDYAAYEVESEYRRFVLKQFFK